MARQQVIVNALFVLLGFAASGGFKHFFTTTNTNNSKGDVALPTDTNTVATEIVKQTTTTTSTTTSTSTPPPPPEDEDEEEDMEPKKTVEDKKVQFVFYMGLEGAGHDYLHKIAIASPALKQLQESNVYPDDAHTLQASLLDHDSGLWSAYYHLEQPEGSLVATRSKLIDTLKSMERKLEDKNSSGGGDGPYYVPVNILNPPSYGPYGPVRYLTTSNDKQSRMISYPAIEIFYDACEEAGVDCRHVYLYRNPYELLHKSTAKHILEAMHTSTSMLMIIASHMRMYPERTLACWNLYNNNDDNNDNRDGGMQKVFGWKEGDTADYTQAMTANYVPLNITSGKDVSAIVPAMNQNYFDSMLKTHNILLRICQKDAVLLR